MHGYDKFRRASQKEADCDVQHDLASGRTEVPAVKEDGTYLGFRYTFMDYSHKISVWDLPLQLDRIQKALQKLQQKLRLLKQYLTARYLYSL